MNSKQRNLVAILVGIATLALIMVFSKSATLIRLPSSALVHIHLPAGLYHLVWDPAGGWRGLSCPDGGDDRPAGDRASTLPAVSVVIADVLYGLYRWLFPEKSQVGAKRRWLQSGGDHLCQPDDAHPECDRVPGWSSTALKERFPIQTPRDADHPGNHGRLLI